MITRIWPGKAIFLQDIQYHFFHIFRLIFHKHASVNWEKYYRKKIEKKNFKKLDAQNAQIEGIKNEKNFFMYYDGFCHGSN